LNYRGYCISAYPSLLAIRRVQPNYNRLSSLAGIARAAAKRDIFASNYSSIVNDVFPTRAAPKSRFPLPEDHAAIYARCIALDGLLL
jgi:hypothetical protein